MDCLEKFSKDKKIIITFVEKKNLDISRNFYEISIKKNNITNFMFICWNYDIHKKFLLNNIPSYFFKKKYAKNDLILDKLNIEKVQLYLDILKRGYSLLVSEPEVIFLKNPWIYENDNKYDYTFTVDGINNQNSGFYLLNSKKSCIKFFETILKYRNLNEDNFYKIFNYFLRDFSKRNKINVNAFDVSIYRNGLNYFDTYPLYFDNICSDCIIIHNNWINNVETKIYRFKEHLMWRLDDNQYYSSRENKYLTYKNFYPVEWNIEKIKENEINQLINALIISRMLDRILILPKFSCKRGICSQSLESLLDIKKFDKYFKDDYRESSFLQNDLVPYDIKHTQSVNVLIRTNLKDTNENVLRDTSNSIEIKPENIQDGLNQREIVLFFNIPQLFSARRLNVYGLLFKNDNLLNTDIGKEIYQNIIKCSEFFKK